jgi:hypothetical protein
MPADPGQGRLAGALGNEWDKGETLGVALLICDNIFLPLKFLHISVINFSL